MEEKGSSRKKAGRRGQEREEEEPFQCSPSVSPPLPLPLSALHLLRPFPSFPEMPNGSHLITSEKAGK